jgi:hypothetical protein
MKNKGINTSMINSEDGEEVKVKTWKNFCKEFSINKISLLKINIEGAEYDLLDSFDNQDFENIDQIAISFHDWMIPEWKSKTEKSLSVLESKNFSLQKINNPWNWFLATKKEFLNEKYQNKKKNEIHISFLDTPQLEIKGNTLKNYYVEFLDENDNVIYSSEIKTGMWTSCNKKHYKKWKIKINGKIVHDLNNTFIPYNNEVMVYIDNC